MKISNTNLFYLNGIINLTRATSIENGADILKAISLFESKVHPVIKTYAEAFNPLIEEMQPQNALKIDIENELKEAGERAATKITKEDEALIKKKDKELKIVNAAIKKIEDKQNTINETIVEVDLTKEECKSLVSLIEHTMTLNVIDRAGGAGVGGKNNIELILNVAKILNG